MTTTSVDPSKAPSTRRKLLFEREVAKYPSGPVRYTSLTIAVLATITLYYQFYLVGGVAARILVDYDMSFGYFVTVNVIASFAGAFAALAAGLTDKYGRANIVILGILITSLLCVFGLANASNGPLFSALYILVGFVEGIVLVATPALVRDFSPQLGRASAMGFWTLGPVLGSLFVAIQVSQLDNSTTLTTQFVICGMFGIVVSILAFVFLRELSPALRDQVMVSAQDTALLEARARGIDVDAASAKPYRQMLKPDIIAASIAISAFLIIYYMEVGYFPIYFQTVFGMTQTQANQLGNWSWSFLAIGLLIVGWLSDKLRVRKPFMLAGAIGAIAFTIVFLSQADNPATTNSTLVPILVGLNLSLGLGFAPWMASFTETVERRNPAMVGTGLAIYGMTLRTVLAVTILLMPVMVTTVTTLVEKGPVAGELAQKYSAELATAGKVSPATTAALQANPADSVAKTQALSEVSGVPATVIETSPGDPAVADAAAQLDALAQVPPEALATLGEVGQAAAQSPGEWQKYFWVAVGGEVLFIPLIFFMAGFWNPRRAREEELAHQKWMQAELTRIDA